MAFDPKTAGSKFLADIFAKLPAELQGKAKEVFESADAAAALEEIGRGTLRQGDYSKLANDLKTKETELETWHGELAGWFETNKAAIAKGRETPAPRDPADPARPNPNPAPAADVVTKAEFEKVLGDTERGAVAFFSQLNSLGLTHYQQFGEVLNTDVLMSDPRLVKGQLSLQQVYQDVHKDKIAAKAQAAEDAKVAKIREEERAKLQVELARNVHPYPVNGQGGPSTLDALEAAKSGTPLAVKTVDEMVNEYHRLGAGRTS